MQVFHSPTSSKEEIAAAGEEFILALYNGSKSKSLDEFRPLQYKRTVGRSRLDSSFDFRTLPPTSAAAEPHSFRVYLQVCIPSSLVVILLFRSLTSVFSTQVQEWLLNYLPATEWGWEADASGEFLLPIPCNRPPAPEFILKLIRCGCQKGCERGCECRRAGLPCTQMCFHCGGIDCSNNGSSSVDSENSEENPDDPAENL